MKSGLEKLAETRGVSGSGRLVVVAEVDVDRLVRGGDGAAAVDQALPETAGVRQRVPRSRGGDERGRKQRDDNRARSDPPAKPTRLNPSIRKELSVSTCGHGAVEL